MYILSVVWLHNIIILTSYWARWCLKPPASRLFTQPFLQAQIKERSKPRIAGDRRFSRTKGPVTQKMFPFDEVHVTFLLLPNHTACTDRYADHISHKGGWINLDNKICRHHQSISDMWYHALISCGGWFIITGIYFKDFTLYVPCGDWNDKQMNIWFTQLWNN